MWNISIGIDALKELKEILTDNYSVRLIEDGIYSVLPDNFVRHHYDGRAAVYDLIVGTRLYNSVVWGGDPPITQPLLVMQLQKVQPKDYWTPPAAQCFLPRLSISNVTGRSLPSTSH